MVSIMGRRMIGFGQHSTMECQRLRLGGGDEVQWVGKVRGVFASACHDVLECCGR